MEETLKLSRIDYIGLLILTLVNLLLKIPITAQGFFAFTYDQGRDLLKVAQIVFEHQPTLIGPTSGLQGIFYGPWWYYFLSPILFFSKGNPQGVANFFGLLAVLTVIFLFFLLRKVTGSSILAFSLALIASMSSSWMLGPTLIWNTSLTPVLLIAFFYVILRISNKPSYSLFFFMGIIAFLIMDSELPFGLMLSLNVLISLLLFRKIFYKKHFLLTFLGMAAILSPRIIFDIKHNFLISKSIASYIIHPINYGQEVPIINRLYNRLDLYWEIFSQAFTKNNKIFALALIIAIGVLILIISRDKRSWHLLKNDFFLRYLLVILAFSLVFFTIFKDIVWNYYLIGLPILFIVILSKIFLYAYSIKELKIPISILILILVVLNFNSGLISPFKISWLGDGGTYRNQKMVMDYISSQNPQN